MTTHFDLRYHGKYQMKFPTSFVSQLRALTHLTIAPIGNRMEPSDLIRGLKVTDLPKSLKKLVMKHPNALAAFVLPLAPNSDSASSNALEMIDVSSMFPHMHTLKLNLAFLTSFPGFQFESSKLPSSLTSLRYWAQSLQINIPPLPQHLLEYSLTSIQPFLSGVLPPALVSFKGYAHLELMNQLPSTLIYLHCNIPFYETFTQASEAMVYFPPNLTYLHISGLPLTVSIVKNKLPRQLTRLSWLSREVEPEALQHLPSTLTRFQLPWLDSTDHLVHLPPNITRVDGYAWTNIPERAEKLEVIPQWIDNVIFRYQNIAGKLFDQPKLLERLSGQLTKLSLQDTFMDFKPPIQVPLHHLVDLTIDLDTKPIYGNEWMQLCPSLKRLDSKAPFDFRSLLYAPFVLEKLIIPFNMAVVRTMPEFNTAGADFDWNSFKSVASLLHLDLRVWYHSIAKDDEESAFEYFRFPSTEPLYLLKPSEFPSLITTLVSHLPKKLEQLHVVRVRPLSRSEADREALIPTSVIKSLPKLLQRLRLEPLAVFSPLFCASDLANIPRSVTSLILNASDCDINTVKESGENGHEGTDFHKTSLLTLPPSAIASLVPPNICELTIPSYNRALASSYEAQFKSLLRCLCFIGFSYTHGTHSTYCRSKFAANDYLL